MTESEGQIKLHDIKKIIIKDESGQEILQYLCRTCGSALLTVPRNTISFIESYEKFVKDQSVKKDVLQEE